MEKNACKDWPWTGLILSVLYIFLMWSLPNLPHQPYGHENDSQHKGEVAHKLIPFCAGTECTDKEKASHSESEQPCQITLCNFWNHAGATYDKTVEDPVALFTLLLVVVTASLAWYTARLYAATVKLGADAEITGLRQARMMNASLEEATRAASAAEKSANATKFLAEVNRAWVLNNKYAADLTMQNMAIGHVVVYLIWENAGGSPAINLSINIQHKLIGPDDTIPHFIADHSPPEGRATLAQRAEVHTQEIRVNASSMDDLLKGKLRLIVYSSVQYETLFTELGFRNSEVCMEITPSFSPPEHEWSSINVGKQNTAN